MTLRNRSSRRSSRDRGAAAVELALLLPILLIIVFGIIDFGRMFHAQLTLTEAAREGARAESLGSDPDLRVQEAAGRLGAVGTEVAGACPDSEDAIVYAHHDFTFVTPLSPILELYGSGVDGSYSLSGKGVMPCFD